MDSQRGLVQRIERRLETSVGDAFARMFGGAIVPQELEAALRREAADGVRALDGNRLLAPNEYVITLSVHDYQQLGADQDHTVDAFARNLAGHIGEQGWETYGDVVVRFQESPNLHTGQVRARGAVNPDASPRLPVTSFTPQQSDHASSAEPGVAPMTDNPSYHGGQGQGRPDDERYGRQPDDERYGRQSDDERPGQEPRGPYPPDPGRYPPEQGGYPDPGPGGFAPPRPPDQGGYPPPYEQRPPVGYGAPPGFDPGYRQPPPSGYGPPSGGPQDYGADYGRPRHDDYVRPEPRPEQRPPFGDQGAPPYARPDYGQPDYGQPDYGQPDYGRPDYGRPDYGRPDYGRPDYGRPDYGRYDEGGPGGPIGYDYGQPPAPGGGYGPPGGPPSYAPPMITLQLDDGSGRTYQLRDGINVVGRGQDAQFRLPDTGVSRRHLEIRWDGRVALLSDLNSTNGTTVNNAPVQEWQLADGDVIRLGHSEIVVRVH